MPQDENLESLLPQARPMILLSGYDPNSSGYVVDAWVDVSPASPFYEVEPGGVPGCIALEYMAQTMALGIGILRNRAGLPPKMGFVLGSRKLEVSVPFFKPGERYAIRAENTYQDESFGSFDCTIRDAAGEVVAKAQVTAFQPEDGITPDELEDFS